MINPAKPTSTLIASSVTNILADAENISRVYNQLNQMAALSAVTCQVKKADRIALVGPSGSGKSTLLQLLAGLDLPSAGTLTWPALGARETLRPSHLAMVFQMPSLLAPLSVVENVELPLLLGSTDPRQAREKALELLNQFGLEALASKLLQELSGGQNQRVALARALICQPKLILADEPTGQLDQQTAQQLFDVLLVVLAHTDTALVVATHDPNIAHRMQQQWHLDHGYLELPRTVSAERELKSC